MTKENVVKGMLQSLGIDYNKLQEYGYFDAPASSKFHLVKRGGLVEHSLNVANILCNLTKDNKIVWEREESPMIIGLLHDLCKCDSYIKDGEEFDSNGMLVDKFMWNDEQTLLGHGEKSVMLASTVTTLTLEEVHCIRYHMGAYVSSTEQKELNKNWGILSKAIDRYPNIMWCHQADMMATHIVEK